MWRRLACLSGGSVYAGGFRAAHSSRGRVTRRSAAPRLKPLCAAERRTPRTAINSPVQPHVLIHTGCVISCVLAFRQKQDPTLSPLARSMDRQLSLGPPRTTCSAWGMSFLSCVECYRGVLLCSCANQRNKCKTSNQKCRKKDPQEVRPEVFLVLSFLQLLPCFVRTRSLLWWSPS